MKKELLVFGGAGICYSGEEFPMQTWRNRFNRKSEGYLCFIELNIALTKAMDFLPKPLMIIKKENSQSINLYDFS